MMISYVVCPEQLLITDSYCLLPGYRLLFTEMITAYYSTYSLATVSVLKIKLLFCKYNTALVMLYYKRFKYIP